MSVWDKLPHRIMINRALRKASEELKSDIDKYQKAIKEKTEENNREIEQAIQDSNVTFERKKASMEKQLTEKYNTYYKLLTDYINIYFAGEQTDALIKIKNKELNKRLDILKMISEYIDEISKEISLLKDRKNMLIGLANVSDIIELINLSDSGIEVNSDDNAEILLEKIEGKTANENYNTVQRLHTIITERMEYSSEIQYIKWVISVKRNMKEQLVSERKQHLAELKALRSDIGTLKSTVSNYKNELKQKAVNIRDIWIIPMSECEIKICEAYGRIDKAKIKKEKLISDKKKMYSNIKPKKEEKNLLYSELKEIKDDQQVAKREFEYNKANDIYDDNLKRRQIELSKEYDRITSRIGKVKEEMDSIFANIKINDKLIEDINTNIINIKSQKIDKQKAIKNNLFNQGKEIMSIFEQNDIFFYKENINCDLLRIVTQQIERLKSFSHLEFPEEYDLHNAELTAERLRKSINKLKRQENQKKENNYGKN